jgi:hypothetical protein
MVSIPPVRRVVMSLLRFGLVAGALAGYLTGSLAAQAKDRVEALNGKVYVGEILTDDGTTIEIQTNQGARTKLAYDRLTPLTRYRLVRKRTPDDVDSQLDLADWCVDVILYKEARRHFDAAMVADPQRADDVNERLAAARTKAGDELLARAKSLAANNKPKEAREVLKTIVEELPLEPVAEVAARMLQGDSHRQKAALMASDDEDADAEAGASTAGDGDAAGTTSNAPDPNAGADSRVGKPAVRASGKAYTKRTRKIMKACIQHYYNMIDWTTGALVHTSQSNSVQLYQAVILERLKMLKALDEVRPQGEINEEMAEGILLVEQKTEEAVVEAQVNLAMLYLRMGSDQDAAKVVDAGLADYAENPRLLQARERVSKGEGRLILGERRRQ